MVTSDSPILLKVWLLLIGRYRGARLYPQARVFTPTNNVVSPERGQIRRETKIPVGYARPTKQLNNAPCNRPRGIASFLGVGGPRQTQTIQNHVYVTRSSFPIIASFLLN